MIRASVVLNYLGKIVFIIGIAMLISVAFSVYYKEAIITSMLISSLITLSIGAFSSFIFKHHTGINYRECFALVTFGWLAASLFGTLPYILSGFAPSFADAFFETVSGFTTTGASIFPDVESLPKSLLFWRSITNWLGGIGIMALFITVISGIGVMANQIFRSEVPGPVSDKISPRIRESAKRLLLIYLFMSLLLTILLFAFGMDIFDSLCHTFATVATGGFSTKNTSLTNYNPLIQWTIIVFMFLAGANFTLHYLALLNRSLKAYKTNSEFKSYLYIVIIASLVVFAGVSQYPGWEERVRQSMFQVVSIITTTGFATADYNFWSPGAQVILLILMLVGGCAGSTAGNIKVGRYMILFECAKVEIKKMVHPKSVWPIRFSGKILNDALVLNVLKFFFIYIFFAAIGIIILSLKGLDLISSISACFSCIGNIGPGFNLVGPMQNYGQLPDLSKYILSILMLLGRLEIYPVLIMFSSGYWKE